MKLVNLPPGLSPTLQLYARNSDNTVGSAVGTSINGTAGAVSTEYNFNLSSRVSGDWYAVLSGVSNPDGGAFPVRDDVAYFIPWPVIEATIRATPPTPSPITGLCNLLFSIVNGSGSPVYKASCYAQLDNNSTYDGGLVASTVYSAQTDEDGLATLVCIRDGQFTAGGVYTLRATDRQGLLLWTKRVRIPNTSSANAEDLTAV